VKIGVRNVIFMYAFLAIGLEITIWVVPSMIENAVAVFEVLLHVTSSVATDPAVTQVAIIGLFMGPMYPLVMTHTSKVLPKWLVTGSIGWIAGFGQAGSAVIPFITGVVASKYSINALQPLYVLFSAYFHQEPLIIP
jgi:fucose permease